MSQLERFQSDRKLATPDNRLWVQQYAQRRMNYPIALEIDATNKCPLACAHCIWSDLRSSVKDSLQPNALLRVVDEAAEIGVRALTWTGGGEPLSHPTTVEGIKKAASLGLRNGMFTTAVPMTPQVTEVLLENLTWVRFHLDGATPTTYGSLHQVNPLVFDKVTENIRNFTVRRRETGARVSAGMNTVALESDIEDVGNLARLAKDLGLDFFQYKHDLTRTYQPQYQEWWDGEVIPVMDQLSRELTSDGFQLQYVRKMDLSRPDLSPACHIHHALTAITADGRVSFCKNTRDEVDWSIGSIYEAHLRDIFDGERHRRLKQQITPSNCGVIPCPNKSANLTINKVVETGSLDSMGPTIPVVEHQDFI